MKGTETFKKTIETYLTERAKTDSLFAVSFAKPNKNINECINYIFSEVQKSGCNGFADDEIYGMAVHYYDEDNLGEIKATSNARVVVNHSVELTEEEKAKAREEAKQRAINEAYNAMRKTPTTTPVKAKQEEVSLDAIQTSLF